MIVSTNDLNVLCFFVPRVYKETEILVHSFISFFIQLIDMLLVH